MINKEKIAREFELNIYPTMPDMLSAKAMLEFLLKNYYIVPKSKAKEALSVWNKKVVDIVEIENTFRNLFGEEI